MPFFALWHKPFSEEVLKKCYFKIRPLCQFLELISRVTTQPSSLFLSISFATKGLLGFHCTIQLSSVEDRLLYVFRGFSIKTCVGSKHKELGDFFQEERWFALTHNAWGERSLGELDKRANIILQVGLARCLWGPTWLNRTWRFAVLI